MPELIEMTMEQQMDWAKEMLITRLGPGYVAVQVEKRYYESDNKPSNHWMAYHAATQKWYSGSCVEAVLQQVRDRYQALKTELAELDKGRESILKAIAEIEANQPKAAGPLTTQEADIDKLS